MRIVAGVHKGRPLSAPRGMTTRPTSDRAREALFNKLVHAPWGPDLAGARVIDVFAGSGALGFEALSRGAAFVLFVETDPGARGAIRTNVEAFQAFGVTKLHKGDAVALGPKPDKLGPPFALALLDPPYGKGMGERALAKLHAGGWLAQGALAVLETGADEEPDLTGWEVLDTQDSGAARFWFVRRA